MTTAAGGPRSTFAGREGCWANREDLANTYLFNEFGPELIGTPRGDELDRLEDEISAYADEQEEAYGSVREEVVARLEAELEEARARVEERFGAAAAFVGTFDCPWDEAPLVA